MRVFLQNLICFWRHMLGRNGNSNHEVIDTKLKELDLMVTGNHVSIKLLENDATFDAVVTENMGGVKQIVIDVRWLQS